MKLMGTFHDKQLYVYDPKIKCTEVDFDKFVSRFSRIATLRHICFMSSQLFLGNNEMLIVGDIPVGMDILCDFAYRVIKYCDDNTKQIMNDEQNKLALKMCHVLYDSSMLTTQKRDSHELLTLLAYRQFPFQQRIYNNFARNYYIYTDLWYRVKYAQGIDVLAEIESEIGIPYEFACLYAFALVGNKEGHFWIYDKTAIEELNRLTGLELTVDSHQQFVKWCSGDYQAILSQKNELPPFVRYPVVETRFKPIENKDEVYLIVSQHLLHDKVTSGLYFYLMDRFNRGSNKNEFKEIFGIVFQEYVGELLHYYFRTWNVIPEIKYKKGKSFFQDSVDWIIFKDDKLIMIEVKQSSIFMNSKHNSFLKNITSDLRKTVIHGIKQLETTETDIKSQKYPELQRFRKVKSFMKLVVVNDPLFNANHIVKTFFKDEVSDIGFHIININEFETLLSCQRDAESLFDVLYFKTLKQNKLDFNEYIYNIFPDAKSNIEFLEPIHEEFFRKIRVKE